MPRQLSAKVQPASKVNEVLKALDEKVIQPYFKLPDLFDEKEFEALVDGESEDEEVTEIDGEEQD